MSRTGSRHLTWRRAILAATVLAALAGGGAWSARAAAGRAEPPRATLIRGATIWTIGPDGVLTGSDLLMMDGKIAKIGKGISAPEGAEIVEAAGMHVTPGLIDAHSHTAVAGSVNEGSHNITAEVRIRDVVDPEDVAIYRELAGGLTTANVLHGSANSIGGQNAIIKLRWHEPAPALLFEAAPPGIKFALGENPKRSNFRVPGGKPRYPTTRMGVAASIRAAFVQARDYRREQEAYRALSAEKKRHVAPPRTDLQMEALVEILEGKRVVHAHCYRQDEILMLIRLAEEFGFKIGTFQHVLEGYKVADEIAAHGAGASTFSDWWAYKAEAYDAIPYNGALMAERGVIVSFNSDSDELARRLNLEAAKAVKYGGLGEEQALGFVTINPARQLGIDKRVGSLEKGKDADVALWSGHPLSTYTVCEKTWVDGIKRFDRDEDLARREADAAERAELIETVKAIEKADAASGKKDAAKADEKAGRKDEKVEEKKEGEDASSEEAKPAAPNPAPVPVAYHVPPNWSERSFALVGGTVHTVSGPDIPGGTVLVRDGKIAAVGPDVAVPAGAEKVDVSGLHVYPGMIDADTVLGLTEIESVPGTVDVSETGDFNPDARADLAVNPDSELIPVTRANGITHVLTAPRGGIISGTGALLRLDGWTWEDLAAASSVAMHVEYPAWKPAFSFATFSRQTPEEVKKQREEAFKELKQFLDGARAYKLARDAEAEGGKPPERVAPLEAMLPVLDGKIPVIVHADDVRQIKSAVDWAAKEKLRIIIEGGADAWRVADLLAERKIPVILGSVLDLPARRDEPYDTPFTAASRLHDAGVSFCIAGGGGAFEASNTRILPYRAAMAAAFGLDKAEALRSVTLYPAEILGAGAQLGSIEPGKSASLVVADGDLLEIRTRIERVYIDGRPVDLMNKHRRLYERYKRRPKPQPARAQYAGPSRSGAQGGR